MDQDSCFIGGVPIEINKEVLYLSVLIPIDALQRNADKRRFEHGNFPNAFSHMGELQNNPSYGRVAVIKISTQYDIRIFDSFSEALDSLYFFLNY